MFYISNHISSTLTSLCIVLYLSSHLIVIATSVGLQPPLKAISFSCIHNPTPPTSPCFPNAPATSNCTHAHRFGYTYLRYPLREMDGMYSHPFPRPASRCTTAGEARGRVLGKEGWERQTTRDGWMEVGPGGVKDAQE